MLATSKCNLMHGACGTIGTQPHIVAPRWEDDVRYDEDGFIAAMDRQRRRMRGSSVCEAGECLSGVA
jgi:hypothetical protein